MIPLSFLKVGEKAQIKKVGGKDETKRHLHNLGFVEGSDLSVVSENAGNLIINVKESRVAISRETASKIIVM